MGIIGFSFLFFFNVRNEWSLNILFFKLFLFLVNVEWVFNIFSFNCNKLFLLICFMLCFVLVILYSLFVFFRFCWVMFIFFLVSNKLKK